MEVGSTKSVLKVAIRTGTHPFYTGSQKSIDTEIDVYVNLVYVRSFE